MTYTWLYKLKLLYLTVLSIIWRKTIGLSWFTKLLCFMNFQPLEDIDYVLESIWGFDFQVR